MARCVLKLPSASVAKQLTRGVKGSGAGGGREAGREGAREEAGDGAVGALVAGAAERSRLSELIGHLVCPRLVSRIGQPKVEKVSACFLPRLNSTPARLYRRSKFV